MFNQRRTNPLPGYTGHIPSVETEPVYNYSREPRSQIPGYTGHIPSIASENLFGTTYGKTTLLSAKGEFPSGLDHEPHYKYKTLAQEQFIDLKTVREPTASEMLGVTRSGPDTKSVVPVEALNAYWGVVDEDREARKAHVTFSETERPLDTQKPQEDLASSNKNFFGIDSRTEPQRHGEPIPGYTGFSRKVAADNIFGQTYANARKTAAEEMRSEQVERAQVLQERAVFVPAYMK
jgi:hypothetical protein